ncbi:MAG: hypothetical protein JNL50_00255 [Phycisphaerae bacterium]|nr:hypothetical protein [Phycisphaerae bacterium]
MTSAPWASLSLRRFVFGGFAALLFVMTHWPRVAIPAEGRWDLLVHAGVFGLWAVLLMSTAPFGPWRSPRNIARCAPIAVIYACIDEGLQAVPLVRRVAAWDDLAANIAGVLIASLIVSRFRVESKA